MIQLFHRYELWEDYQNGMFRNVKDGNEEKRIQQAYNLFRNENKLYEEMCFVAYNWKYASEVNLTNNSINHQAWLGQASCCHYCGCGDYETIQAWHRLTNEERKKANDIADKVYYEWKNWFEKQQPNYQLNIFDLEEVA